MDSLNSWQENLSVAKISESTIVNIPTWLIFLRKPSTQFSLNDESVN